MQALSVIGLDYRRAPLEIRERFAISNGLLPELLHAFHCEGAVDEAMILATCNRTEFYFVAGGNGHSDPLAYFLDRLGQLKGSALPTDQALLYHYEGPEAVRHLFRVSASLESQILGEHQILGQVKEAYRLAVEARTAKFLLNKVCHAALRVGKRVRTETDLGYGNASISQAAVSLTRRVFSDLSGLTVLLVGAGQNSEVTAKALIQAGVTRLIVANRTLSRAEQLAAELSAPAARPSEDDEDEVEMGEDVTCPALQRLGLGGAASSDAGASAVNVQAIGLERLAEFLNRVDVVISSTGAEQTVLTYDDLAETLRRAGRTVLLVDIAVPRDVDPRLAEVPNVYLYTIDDLTHLVDDGLRQRQAEVPRAEGIIEAEVHDFDRWLDSLQAAPTIQRLHSHCAALQDAQLARYANQFDPEGRRQVEQFTGALCRKILHQPVAFLREISRNGSTSETLAAIELIRRMFGLDAEEEQHAGAVSSRRPASVPGRQERA